MRPRGPFVAPDQFFMAPDGSYAMHEIISVLYIATPTWNGCGLHISMIILLSSYTLYEMELKWCVPSKQLDLQWFKCIASYLKLEI